MTNELLADLQMWQQEAGTNRTVKIELGALDNKEYRGIWVFDYSIPEGAFVTTSEDLKTLNLKEKHREKLKAEYLKAMED